MRRILVMIGLCLVASGANAAAALRDVHVAAGAAGTRIVLELSQKGPFRMFTLAAPDRVVIDLPATPYPPPLPVVAAAGLITGSRSGRVAHGTRLVLCVSGPVQVKSSLLAAKPGSYEIALDLQPGPLSASAKRGRTTTVAAAPTASFVEERPHVKVPAGPFPPTLIAEHPPVRQAPAERAQVIPATSRNKPLIIAIDAGHGGDDPGAQGPHGLQEKTVTLAIALDLARLIDRQPGMRAVLTRKDDTYVGLRERTEIARQAQADLFISIHANAYHDRSMRGTAVYVLSDHGATSEQARWVAQHENAADLVGGVHLKDKDDEVAAVLIDISQTATMEASFVLGNRLLDSLGSLNVLQKPRVQQAGFMVLKSPDIPSVLVETAFISNSREEQLLGSAGYQERMAQALLRGIRGYMAPYRSLPKQQVAEADIDASDENQAGGIIPVKMTKSAVR